MSTYKDNYSDKVTKERSHENDEISNVQTISADIPVIINPTNIPKNGKFEHVQSNIIKGNVRVGVDSNNFVGNNAYDKSQENRAAFHQMSSQQEKSATTRPTEQKQPLQTQNSVEDEKDVYRQESNLQDHYHQQSVLYNIDQTSVR